ncbi:thioesterase II family protein [Enterovibrio paralichthyis]|uniref:thioesterase II family protein n=1 Tax=Enterovibrio paralichthyis TaxID=2853805 RepID=UPI001C464C4E|nr:alpha/beta fold hydrolase [Enterovibrio paralichthyis]MBV7298358.1 alpha/beta fold hydrolase [Enterovibrio paralichthyis]
MAARTRAGSWLGRALHPEKVNVVCFPFAGGSGASYASLESLLGEPYHVVPVEFPGRDGRRGEPFITCFTKASQSILDETCDALAGFRVVIYGHSMGAWFAWSLAKALAERGEPAELLVVAAQRAPSLAYPFIPNEQMDDETMLEYLHGFESFAGMKVSMNILTQWILPVIRADLSLCESHNVCHRRYRYPALVLGATQDTFVTSAALQSWEQHFEPPTAVRTLDTGHFFIRTDPEWVADNLRSVHKEVEQRRWKIAG